MSKIQMAAQGNAQLITPFFTSNYSFNSILTLDECDDSKSPDAADSIFEIAKDENLEDIFLIENNCVGFLTAKQKAKKEKRNIHLGLRLVCADSIKDKTEESRKSEHDIVVFERTKLGYEKLKHIYTKASTEGFYHVPRIDSLSLKELWDENLILLIPFYDSFIFKNLLYSGKCLPDFGSIPITYCYESHELPFDHLVSNALNKISSNSNRLDCHSIYYKRKEDFTAYLTIRCLQSRSYQTSTLSKPNMEHMSSDSFCAEYWKQLC